MAKFLIILCSVWLFSAGYLPAAVPFRQVTTHPNQDLTPRLSPNGKWLAYTSKKSGNNDIWIRNMRTAMSYQVTFHKADDYQPAWDPKSEYIVFVSQRSDAKGDLYRLVLNEKDDYIYAGKPPEQLTEYKGLDAYPSISARRQIVWVSDRSGLDNIWLQNRGPHKLIRQITFNGATHPCWSPRHEYLVFTSFRSSDDNHGDIWFMNVEEARRTIERINFAFTFEPPVYKVTRGAAMDGFPMFSPDEQKIVFVRRQQDTNGDQQITLADQAILSVQDIRPSVARSLGSDTLNTNRTPRPVTFPQFNAVQPEWGRDQRFYFASRVKGNFDVWTRPDSNAMPEFETARDQFNHAINSFQLPHQWSSSSLDILFYEQDSLSFAQQQVIWSRTEAVGTLIDRFPDSTQLCANAWYEQSIGYWLLGMHSQAGEVLDSLRSKYRNQVDIQTLGQILRVALDLEQRHGDLDRSWTAFYDSLSSMQNDIPRSMQAHVALLKANLLFRAGNFNAAHSAFSSMMTEFDDNTDVRAQSRYMIARVANRQGKTDRALNGFSELLTDSLYHAEWSPRAQQQFFSIVTRELTRTEKIAQYIHTARENRHAPRLSAASRLRAADLLQSQGEMDSARTLYTTIVDDKNVSSDQQLTARLQRAELYLKTGEFQAFHEELYSLMNSLEPEHPRWADQAKQLLLKGLLQTGAELQRRGNIKLAAVVFKRAWSIDNNYLPAHRGYIQCLEAARQIDEIVKEYKVLSAQLPDNNIILYSAGLALSYQATAAAERENSVFKMRPKVLKESNTFLHSALALDYTLIDAYLTLSYNYEALETYYQALKDRKKPFLKRALNTIVDPLLWLYDTVTFWTRDQKVRYYEQAIRELSRALALNDESQFPQLEARLALNMANNYYNLGEFGFENAYRYYHLKLKYDNTFKDKNQQALIYERMGHCAFVLEDLTNGVPYLTRAVRLYQELDQDKRALSSLKRLALLYELDGNHENAVEYYKQAMQIEQRLNLYNGLMRSYRSIAHNNNKLQNYDQAAGYAEKALSLLKSDLITKSEDKPLYIELGLFGLYVPVPYDLRRLGLQSTLSFSSMDETAFIYSILGQTHLARDDFDRALEYYQDKQQLYLKEHDYEAVAIVYNNMGYINYLRGDYQNAWDHFREAYWKCRKTNYIAGEALNLRNAGQIFLARVRSRDLPERPAFKEARRWLLKRTAVIIEQLSTKERSYYRDLIDFHAYRADAVMVDPLHYNSPNPVDKMRATLFALEHSQEALNHLEEALRISKSYQQDEQTAALQYKIGKLQKKWGDMDKAFSLQRNALNLAREQQRPDLVWKTYTQLGLIAERLPDSVRQNLNARDALYYYQQALNALETEFLDLPGMDIKTVLNLYENPYKLTIQESVERGDTLNALACAQRMRAATFMRISERSNPRFANPSHNLMFQQAASLRDRLRTRQHNGQITTGKQPALNADKEPIQTVQARYDSILTEISNSAPALLPYLKPVTIPAARIQTHLLQGQMVYYQTHIDGKSLVWLITRDTIQLVQIPVDYQINDLQADSERLQRLDQIEIVKQLLQPVSEYPDVDQLIVIPDRSFLLYPWFDEQVRPNTRFPRIIRLNSSLYSYYQFDMQEHISGDRIAGSFSAALGDTLSALNYQIIPRDSLSGWGGAHIIHLAGRLQVNAMAPLKSVLELSGLKKLAVQDFLRYRQNAYCLVLDLSEPPDQAEEAMIALEQTLLYSGIGTLVLTVSNQDDSYYDEFYRNLRETTVHQAFHGEESHYLTSRYLYGFQGMTPEEELKSRQDNVEQLVQRGDQAFDDHQFQQALSIYHRALTVYRYFEWTEQVVPLLNRMLECAVNGAMWDEAVSLQQQLIEQARQHHNVENMAAGYFNLAYYYNQQQESRKAIDARQEYNHLVKEYGLSTDEGRMLEETAAIYQRGGEYEQAIRAYQEAAQIYAGQNRIADQSECIRHIADIWSQQNRPVQARRVHIQALELLKSADLPERSAQHLLRISELYAQMDLFNNAYEYAQQARNLIDPDLYPGTAADIVLQVSRLHMINNNPYAAKQAAETALQYYRANGGQSDLYQFLLQISRVQAAFHDMQSAVSTAYKALESTGPQSQKRSQVLETLAWLDRKWQNHRSAVFQLQSAADLDSVNSQPLNRARHLLQMAYLYREQGLKLKAMETNLIVQQINDSLQNVEIDIKRHLLSSLLYEKQEGLNAARSALDSARYYAYPLLQAAAMTQVARHNMGVNDSLGWTMHTEALNLLKTRLASVYGSQLKLMDSPDYWLIYQQLFNIFVNNDRPRQALLLADRIEQLHRIRQFSRYSADFPGSLRSFLSARDSLNQIVCEHEWEYRYALTRSDTVNRNPVDKSYADLDQLYQNPDVSEPLRQLVIPGQDTLSGSRPSNTVTLIFKAVDNYLYSWGIEPDNVRFDRKELIQPEFEQTLEQFLVKLQTAQDLGQEPNYLYDTVIKPWEKSLNSFDQVVIIAYGKLKLLPFAALRSGEEWLGLTHHWSRANQLSEMTALPDPASADLRIKTVVEPLRIEYSQSPYSRMLARDLSYDYTVNLLQGKGATVSNVSRPDSGLFSLLFNCPARSDSVDPLRSFVALSPDSTLGDKLELGFLIQHALPGYQIVLSEHQMNRTGMWRAGADILLPYTLRLYQHPLILFSTFYADSGRGSSTDQTIFPVSGRRASSGQSFAVGQADGFS
ncbi:MAG: tetratricopeptide repeat protein [candidate division KSB1 bacterium]|nr:tetratricopeptide repeat protein [candidate division KSB1 bacterium]